ncbi:hypothetical protein SEA_NICEHOUSE_20 [Rhodococcus phage NiceHouse]|nr:hypothetical protein SEA_NICEHOUSE_20 [Rhodococcus phage NiceHouse]
MNNVRVITPNGEIIGERILETELTIILKTETGRLSIDKTDGVLVLDYVDPASYDRGTIVKLNTIYGEAAYLKARANQWRLVWQSVPEANENLTMTDQFVANSAKLEFTELLQLYVDTPEQG